MKTLTSNKKFTKITISLLCAIGYGTIAFATAPTGGYVPGQTLNPNCAPGTTDCLVASGWNIDTVNNLLTNNLENVNLAGNTQLLGNAASLNEFAGSRYGVIQNGPNSTFGPGPFDTGINLRFIDNQKSAGIFMGDLSGLLPGNTNTIYINNTDDATGNSAYAFFNSDASLMFAAQDANKHSNINVSKDQFRLRHASGPDSTPTGDWHNRIDIADNRVWTTFQRGGGTTPGVDLTTWTETQLDENGFAVKGIDNSSLNQAFLVKNNSGLQALRVMNDGSVSIGALAGGSCPLEVDVSGTIICSTPSDELLKHDINTIQYGLDTVMKLRPVSYKYNNEKYGSGNQIGFVAQEMQLVIPEVVFSSQGHLGINYALLTAVNTKAIQEIELKLENLQKVSDGVTNSTGLEMVKNWLADTANGVEKIIAGKVVTHELCVDAECLTEDDIKQLLKLKQNLQNSSVTQTVQSMPSVDVVSSSSSESLGQSASSSGDGVNSTTTDALLPTSDVSSATISVPVSATPENQADSSSSTATN